VVSAAIFRIILGRAKTEETGGIIRPLGIAEIGRAAGEGVGSHRNPGGIGQVRGSFHHDDQAAGSGNGEAELTRPHAKAGLAGQHLWIPEYGWTTGKRRPPARGARQVIDDRIVGVYEHILTKAGGVTLQIDCCQPGAASERRVPDVGDAVADRDVGQTAATTEGLAPDAGDAVGDRDAAQAGADSERSAPDASDVVGDRDTGQACAAPERIGSDAGDAVWNRYAGQAGAITERRAPDAGDAVGDCIAPGFASRILDERGLALVEQDPINTAIEGVERLHRYRAQADAPQERIIPDAGDAVADRNAGQAGAATERTAPDAGDAVGDRDAGQAGAARERIDPDACDAVRDRHAGQAGAASEGIVPDAGDREAANRAGDGHRTAGTVVSGDGDGAVICQVTELGLHCGGQRQEQQREQARYAGGSDRKLLF